MSNDHHLFLVRKNADGLPIDDPARREIALILIGSMLACLGKIAKDEVQGFLGILMEPPETDRALYRAHLVRLSQHINDLIEHHDVQRTE